MPDLLKLFHANDKTLEKNYHTVDKKGNVKRQTQKQEAKIWKQEVPVIVPTLDGDGSIKDVKGYDVSVEVREAGKEKQAYDLIGIKENPTLTTSLQNNREGILLMKRSHYNLKTKPPFVLAESP